MSYKIAVIIQEIGQSYQSAIISGIFAGAEKYGLNVSAFTSFSGDMNNPRHDMGEFNVFSLPDFSDFDGAILLTNTLSHKVVVNDILERIKIAGIPAVSIDNDLEGFYHIGIDNKSAMRIITEHMINVHNYKRFAYISGPASNPESADRLEAFLEVINEHGLTLHEKAVAKGDFRAPSGKAAVEQFLDEMPEMPEAIVCANDVMAASAITTLMSHGLRVPEDIAVTGFDNTYNSHNYQMELTSVERPLEQSGELACKMLYNHFNNIPQDRDVTLNMSPRFTESCGCGHNALSDLTELKELNYRNFSNFENIQTYMSVLNRMSTQLLECNNFDEYIACLKRIAVDIHPDEFYFCLCENWDSENDVDRTTSRHIKRTSVPVAYTDYVIVPIAYNNGEFHECCRIRSQDIFPPVADSSKEGKLYLINPLHFGERCLGYMVIRSTNLPLQNIMFETFCINISNSLENIRKLMCLEYAVNRLGSLYTMDTFSGIFNRNGFMQATEDIYKECIEKHRDIMLMFIDLDGLKGINDTYGHSTGDKAICSIADVLVESCQNGEIFCRFGGDEFIVFGADYTAEKAQQLTDSIQENINRVNESGYNPFILSASTGYVIASPKEGEDIFSFVTAADKQMYDAKRKKKLLRYA
ncbi:GGDEF domain-containing protein [Ruminococcus flavefaciens]|uniref:substrate-binding and GGDEF domain-containing protein n=1 Tax=Ruminococcus flavefaciens TaxID=1265 RepID=UPI0026EB5967|nr:GGDEF domain-containing protein [Ruminococcus flavefaciens]